MDLPISPSPPRPSAVRVSPPASIGSSTTMHGGQPGGWLSRRRPVGGAAAAITVAIAIFAGSLAYPSGSSESRRGESAFAGVQADRVGHPLVGSWTVRTTDEGGVDPPLLVTFGADGTLLASDAAGRTGHGAWIATAADEADFTYVAVDVGPDGVIVATTFIEGSVAVDAQGGTWSGTYYRSQSFVDHDEASPEAAIEATRIAVRVIESVSAGEPGTALADTPPTPEP